MALAVAVAVAALACVHWFSSAPATTDSSVRSGSSQSSWAWKTALTSPRVRRGNREELEEEVMVYNVFGPADVVRVSDNGFWLTSTKVLVLGLLALAGPVQMLLPFLCPLPGPTVHAFLSFFAPFSSLSLIC